MPFSFVIYRLIWYNTHSLHKRNLICTTKQRKTMNRIVKHLFFHTYLNNWINLPGNDERRRAENAISWRKPHSLYHWAWSIQFEDFSHLILKDEHALSAAYNLHFMGFEIYFEAYIWFHFRNAPRKSTAILLFILFFWLTYLNNVNMIFIQCMWCARIQWVY